MTTAVTRKRTNHVSAVIYELNYAICRHVTSKIHRFVDKDPICFTDKSKNSGSTNKSDGSENVHRLNRDSEDTERDRTKAWTFIESLADAFRSNKAAFLTGFFASILFGIIIMMNDPLDKYKMQERLRKWEEAEKGEIDKQMGYERTLQRQREENPRLYDA